MPPPVHKKEITEEERLELASKLDKDLDEFIDNLPKRPPNEHVPFNRWEEEIANHPFFMKQVPEPGSELHPLYEGLQKLKYDPDENEPEELALSYKDDGNFNFKHRNYRMAIISYTEGIKIKCGNADLEASLYNNRSASHYFLKNHRSALLDAESALKLKPGYNKALSRAAHCCYKLEKYVRCIEYCDLILQISPNDDEVIELRKNSVSASKIAERNRRKKELEAKKLRKEEEMIVDLIKKRGIRIEVGQDNLSLSKLEPQFPQLFDSRVSINDRGGLVWPAIFFYPEYKIMDYIQQFDEENTFMEQLAEVFGNYPDWDRNNEYRSTNLNVYFEDVSGKNVKINLNSTLLEVLRSEGHVVKEGTPRFVVLVAGSRVEQSFLKQT